MQILNILSIPVIFTAVLILAVVVRNQFKPEW